MTAGTAALCLQVKKYSSLYDQSTAERAPDQCNTDIYKDHLLLVLETMFSADLVSQWK